MNTLQARSGKISIHEPLTVDKDHPEEIFERDILERRLLAERILRRLREDDCPRVLGIYGGWGTGKTSLLNLLNQLNEPLPKGISSKLHIIMIDAWEHESSEGLLIPIVVELDNIKGNNVPAKQMAVVVKRALFASGMIFAGAMLKKYTDLEMKQIQEGISDAASHDGIAHESILQKWKSEAKEIKETKQSFASLIDSACKYTGCENIVLCIDNLDRCSPENVVRLLESVKNFFNVLHCTWIFAMDSEVIVSYVNHKYEGTKMDGNSYLDKIIPEQYHLSLSPGMDRKKIVDLLRCAANNDALDFDEEDIPQIPRVLVPRRLIKSAAKVSEFYKLLDQGEARASQPLVFNLVLLYHVWPDFYQRLSSSSDVHIRSVLDNFFPVEKNAQTEESVSTVNANLLPLLKDYAEDQDLSYFLRTVFSEYQQRSKNAFVDEIINGIRGLRMTGLP